MINILNNQLQNYTQSFVFFTEEHWEKSKNNYPKYFFNKM